MKLLNKEQLLKKDELKIEKVEFDDGNYVCVREMTGRERDIFERSLFREVKNRKGEIEFQRNIEDFRAKLAVCTLCDDSGNLLLSFNDVKSLSQNMSAARLEKIVNKAQELNAISEEDRENLSEGSEPTQEDNSTLD